MTPQEKLARTWREWYGCELRAFHSTLKALLDSNQRLKAIRADVNSEAAKVGLGPVNLMPAGQSVIEESLTPERLREFLESCQANGYAIE